MKDIQVKIRKATIADLDSLLILENECFTSDRISRASYRNLLLKQTAEILIATHQQKTIGCAILLFRKQSKKARLYSLAVDKAFRHHGIAIILNEACEKNVRKRSCNKIVLEVRPDNQPAIRFYQKQNYVLSEKFPNFYEDGSEAFRMVKNLCQEK